MARSKIYQIALTKLDLKELMQLTTDEISKREAFVLCYKNDPTKDLSHHRDRIRRLKRILKKIEDIR